MFQENYLLIFGSTWMISKILDSSTTWWDVNLGIWGKHHTKDKIIDIVFKLKNIMYVQYEYDEV